jgi:hypothetical protein
MDTVSQQRMTGFGHYSQLQSGYKPIFPEAQKWLRLVVIGLAQDRHCAVKSAAGQEIGAGQW